MPEEWSYWEPTTGGWSFACGQIREVKTMILTSDTPAGIPVVTPQMAAAFDRLALIARSADPELAVAAMDADLLLRASPDGRGRDHGPDGPSGAVHDRPGSGRGGGQAARPPRRPIGVCSGGAGRRSSD